MERRKDGRTQGRNRVKKNGKRLRWMQEGMKGSNKGKRERKKDKKGKMEIQKGKGGRKQGTKKEKN